MVRQGQTPLAAGLGAESTVAVTVESGAAAESESGDPAVEAVEAAAESVEPAVETVEAGVTAESGEPAVEAAESGEPAVEAVEAAVEAVESGEPAVETVEAGVTAESVEPAVELVVELPGLNDTRDLVVGGDRAYVAGGFYGLYEIDVSVPTAPALLQTYAAPSVKTVALANNLVFAGSRTELTVIDPTLTPAANPVNTVAAWIDVLAVSGAHVYVLRSDAIQIEVYDATDPAKI